MNSVKSLNLTLAMGLTLDFAGALHVYGLADAKGINREIITATILLVVAVLWLLIRPVSDDAIEERVPLWLAILPAVVAMLSISDIMTYVSPGWSPLRLVLFGGGSLLLLGLALRGAPPAAIVFVAFVFGSILRYINMRHIPIEPTRGDMLPLVQQAITNLFRGHDPYTTYFMPWELPLTYLPLTWLAYAPARMMGVDIRWTNIPAEVAVLAAIVFVSRQSRTRAARDAGILLWAWLFLSPTVIHWDLFTSAPIGWAAIAWTLALVATSRHGPAAMVLGLAAATTPLIVVFGPLIALCWWHADGLGGAARRIALAMLLAAALLLPWFLWDPGPFLDGAVRWFNDLNRFPRMKWQTERSWAQFTGFSGLFWQWGKEQWPKPIQIAGVLLVTTVYAVRRGRPAELNRHATAAFLLFMLFNPVLWPYLYNPALVTALLAVACAGLLEPLPVATPMVLSPPAMQMPSEKRFPGPAD